ncbi:sensor histidine kinase YycG [Oxobacter pfennigii]|uniref:histidine kinase n=1 Tax=Oxobacter pfennigii TaxID=36849 RepID=A0A0P8Z036_9CLOT|nr:HAMP domain-containing sensor histidine kinase [Oxobacter pfennigii]KPU45495.1 sensor histidine kinase YycG [Oxobacter pfennigii]
MQSIKKRLSIILILSAALAILFSALLVNHTINRTFNEYLSDNQAKRDERIIHYFEEVYKKDKRWTYNSGIEIMHEAYMSNYCLTLFDADKKVVWGMDPGDVRISSHFYYMSRQNEGIYTTNNYEIKFDGETVGYIEIGQYAPVLLSKEDMEFKLAVNKSIALSVLITILIAGLLSLLLSKQFSKPLIEVSDTSVKLSKGNYDARSRETSKIIEIKNLNDSINILGERLKRQDSIRKRLISDISHEIRTPLNILENNLEAMADGIVPVSNERLMALNDEIIRFGRLLDNLNILKEFEAEEVEMNIIKIAIDKVIGAVIKDYEEELRNKNIEVSFNSDDAEYFVMGDADKLKQVFINIISNAVKFSNEGGKIWIDLDDDKSNIIIKIKDNGIGIAEKDLPFIFERLYRGDKSRNSIEGSGIGLTIVKRILMLHSADISIESRYGEGTAVTVVFNKAI